MVFVNGEECVVLHQFSSRRRESTQEEHDAKNEQKLGSIKMNMIVDSLSMLHCYLQHKVLALYRENVGRNDNKFGTIVQHASKSLKYVDEFDVLMNQLLCSHEFQMAQVFVCMNRVDVWCSQHEFDFDALSDDVVDVARIESNFYHFLLSIKKEAYFDAIYKELFEMKQDGMDPDVMDELDALNAFLINHNAVPVPLFCRFQQWIKANDYNWNAIILDLKHGVDKSKIKQEFGGSIFAAINSFIREQRAHEQSAQIDNIAAINFGVSIHEWLEFNEEPTYRSFRDEIINNCIKRIDAGLYNTYKCECLVLVKVYQDTYAFVLLELMCIKIYTDASELCKAFRMAFWKSKSKKNKKMRKGFYW
eukprot:433581_1